VLFRANFPKKNYPNKINDGEFKDISKRHIRKYSVKHFLKNRPIVQIFGGFQSKLTDFNEPFPHFWDSFHPKWLKIRIELI
jgi:hypothetical protein